MQLVKEPTYLVVAGAAILVSCADESLMTPAAVFRVEVNAAARTLTALGQTVQLVATAHRADGTLIAGRTFKWQSSNTDVLSVDTLGIATAVANGLATITATTDSVSGGVPVTVEQVPTKLAIGTPPSDARSGQPLETQPVIEVQDANGRLVSGDNSTVVTASLGIGGGVLSGNVTMAVQGVAAFTELTITGRMGDRTLVFEAPGLTSTSTGAAFALYPGAADTLLLVSGDVQTGRVGQQLADSLIVMVTDSEGNPVLGQSVMWAVTSGGGTIAARELTDTAGLSKAAWILGTVAGVNTANATLAGVDSATFSATGLP